MTDFIRDFDGRQYFSVWRREYPAAAVETALRYGINALELAHVTTENRNFYDVLSDWKFVEHFRVLDFEKRPLDKVHELTRLRTLYLEDNCACACDPRVFPHLVKLIVEWYESRYLCLSHPALQNLCIYEFKPKEPISIDLPQLEKLSVFGTNIVSLAAWDGCSNLKRIRITRARKFTDLASLRNFPQLEDVWLQETPLVTEFEILNELPNLKIARLAEAGRLPQDATFRPDIQVYR
ncbi:MAG: leucine-rich repeat domain-containing protein [Fimbriimonadaceae bacterium]|nr:leucine-rich repeat domain-containing protein [Fimbriimonadaceae bacterium]